jgi:hypothetical protein
VVRDNVQMCQGLMANAEMGRSYTVFQAITGEDRSARPPWLDRATETQTAQEVARELHRMVSRRLDVGSD